MKIQIALSTSEQEMKSAMNKAFLVEFGHHISIEGFTIKHGLNKTTVSDIKLRGADGSNMMYEFAGKDTLTPDELARNVAIDFRRSHIYLDWVYSDSASKYAIRLLKRMVKEDATLSEMISGISMRV